MGAIEDRLRNYQECQARERALTAQWDDIQLQAQAIDSALKGAHNETAAARADLQNAIDTDTPE